MLQTVAEADKYSRTTLLAGVVETIISVSPVLGLLPFDEILGNSLTYNRELTLPTVEFYNPGDTWAESTPTVTPVTAVLKILGGDSDLDNFLILTRSNEQDIKGSMLAAKVKAMGRTFNDRFVYGDSSVNAKEFDGLHKLITDFSVTTQEVHIGAGSTPGTMTFAKLKELLDAVPGGAQALMMSRSSRRALRKLAEAQGWDLPLTDAGGAIARPVTSYDGTPIFINDFMLDTETIASGAYSAKVGSTGTSIFAMRFGEDGLHGIEAGPGIQIEDVGTLETKDAKRTRVKWYQSLVLLNTVAIARADGIASATAWTA